MRIVTVVGARPQFIKCAPVSEALRQAGHQEFLVHTGQHYDFQMSQVFFDELQVPAPSANLEVGSGPHGAQTGTMLARLEEVLLAERPDWVLVYGDTNSTLAGALAACKLQVPLAHVEAGLRSFNRAMPEEHNRVITDHCADLLLCPTETAIANLAREGITAGAHFVGDTMFDAVLRFGELARLRSTILGQLGLSPGGYLLATVHRAYNTDDPERLAELVCTLGQLGEPVVFPVHPRTRRRLEDLGGDRRLAGRTGWARLIDPVSYLDMLILEENARVILTDSGGMQKEAFFLGVPCLTLRPETEWVETVAAGWNTIVGTEPAAIIRAAASIRRPPTRPPGIFGDGNAAGRIVAALEAGAGERTAVLAASRA